MTFGWPLESKPASNLHKMLEFRNILQNVFFFSNPNALAEIHGA